MCRVTLMTLIPCRWADQAELRPSCKNKKRKVVYVVSVSEQTAVSGACMVTFTTAVVTCSYIAVNHYYYVTRVVACQYNHQLNLIITMQLYTSNRRSLKPLPQGPRAESESCTYGSSHYSCIDSH